MTDSSQIGSTKFAVCFGFGIFAPDNPADLASRGYTPQSLASSQLWRHGPNWLSEPEENWPTVLDEYSPGQELKETENLDTSLFELSLVITDEPIEENSILEPKEISNLIKLKARTAFVFRFIRAVGKNCVLKGPTMKKLMEMSKEKGSLKANELKMAEWYWLKRAQEMEPPTEDQKRDLRLYQKTDSGNARGD